MIEGRDGSLASRLSNGLAASSRSRPINAANTVTISVEGLKSSKAAENEGGGLKDLTIFLERKATTVAKRPQTIRIKKVCVSIRYEGLGG